MQFFIAALQAVAPDFEGLPDPPPLEFQVSDPDVLRERLVAAGLRDVQVDTTQQERLELSTGQEAWDWMFFSNPITGMILDDVGVSEADRARMRAALDEMIRERAGAAGVAVLTAPLNIGWGRKDERPMTGSVLVVGGGIAGRAAARVLARHGLGCTVVERRESVGRGMGVNLPGNAVRALAELGVPDQALASGVPVRRREYRNGRGRLLFAVDDDRFWRDVGRPVCVRHGDLLDALALPEAATLEHARAVAARPTPAGVEVDLEGAPVAAALRLRDRRRRRQLGDAGGGRRRRPCARRR